LTVLTERRNSNQFYLLHDHIVLLHIYVLTPSVLKPINIDNNQVFWKTWNLYKFCIWR